MTTQLGLRLVLVVGCLCLNLDHITLAFSLLITSAPTTVYNIQLTAVLTSVTLVFSLSVNTTITDLIISEFILWITNLRKQIKLHTN
jgi:hypothetical protein